MTPILVAITTLGCLLLFSSQERHGTKRALSSGAGRKTDPEGLREVFPTLPDNRRMCRYRLAGVADAPVLCENEFECDGCHVHGRLATTFLEPISDLDCEKNVAGCRFNPFRFYHRGHTWARIERGGMVRVGVDAMVRELVGNASEVRLPEVERFVEQGEPAFAVVLPNGEVLPMLAPISGEVMAVNHTLETDPGAIRRPEESWSMVIRPFQMDRELQNLLYGPEALAWFQAEVRALQDMVTEPGFAADGGEFRVAAGSGFPWRTFVSQFLLSA